MTTAALRWAVIAVLASTGGCAGAPEPPPTPVPQEAPAADPEAASPEAEVPSAATEAPVAAVVAPARLEVAPPADLAAALRARRPTIEIVPQSCGRSTRAVEVTGERVCLQDAATGLTRAMRRFATTDVSAVRAARAGDDVVVGVMSDDSGAITRYAGGIWRWDLREDRYLGLVRHSADDYYAAAEVGETDFGALVVDGGGERHWVFADGALARVRPFALSFETLRVIDGHTYARETSRSQETLSLVGREGPRVTTETVARYPVSTHLPLRLAFPDDRPLVVSAFPRGASTRVHVVRPPAAEVRAFDVAVNRPRAARMVGEALELRTSEGRFLVDLTTGTVSPSAGPPPEESSEPRQPRPGSFYALVPGESTLVASAAGATFELGPEGARPLEGDAPEVRRSGCRCAEDALVCGEAAPIAGACTRVEDLERLSALDADYEEREDQPATSYAPGGRFRLDRLEPDLVRVTRLSDGARLWVRIVHGAALAQTDDGAFWTTETASLEGYALRWGRSLIDAPVTELARHREAFYRASLVGDFFAGRPLPPADTTLPAPSPTTEAP
jgi:hypothetical protein